jgi:hypothetical protein
VNQKRIENPATNKKAGQFESWARYRNAIETTPISSMLLGGELELEMAARALNASGSIISDGIKAPIDGFNTDRSANAVKTDDVVPSTKPTMM